MLAGSNTITIMRLPAVAFASLLLAGTMSGQRNPPVTVRTLTVERLTRVSTADQQRIARQIKAEKFDSGTLQALGAEIAERMRDALMQLGYFKAIVYDPKVTLVGQDKQHEIVDVLMAVDEGEQYRFKDLAFRNPKAFPAEQLQRQFPLSSGDIFDVEKVRLGLKSLRDLYGQSGYLNFTPVPDTQFNDQERTISLIIDLDEGSVFYVGRLTVAGEESQPGARDKLLQAWKKYEGQRYDPGVMDRFLRDVHARPGVKWEHVLEISQDNANHVVNAYMSLAKLPQ